MRTETISLKELTLASLKVGCLGFGGPAGQIALMQRIFVDEKKWLSEAQYLHALSYCMLLPGPEAQQLAVYVGWLLKGVRGGIIAGALFVLPGALLVLALSWLYAMHAQAPMLAAIFFGIKCAVVALVVEALLKVARRVLKRRSDLCIAGATFVALYFFGLPFPLLILLAALFGLLRSYQSSAGQDMAAKPTVVATAAANSKSALLTAGLWGLLWLLPLALTAFYLGSEHILVEVGLMFSKLAVVTFGGAYAVLTYLQQQAVEVHAWLSTSQMMDGLGLAETTPGPLILVNQFVAFVAAWQSEGGSPGLALASALMASWCTFAPSYLWIFAGAPFAERLRQNPYASGALQAIMACVLGVIANLALWFAMHVLFTRHLQLSTALGSLTLPDLASFDVVAAGFAVLAGVALLRFKTNVVVVVLGAALAGVLVRGALG